MKRQTLGWVLGLLVVWAVQAQAGTSKVDLGFGLEVHSWDSNFRAEGFETLLPLSMRYLNADGTFQLTASTAFVQGHYVTRDLGFGGSEFDGRRLTDTTVGVGFSAPLGSFETAAVVQANLPTGDKRWETTQSSASIPVEFTTSRYRGRGFGLGGLLGMTRAVGGSWTVGASGGYLYSSAVDTGLEWGKFQPGSYGVGILSLGRKTGSYQARVKATRYFAQDTRAGDTPIFRVPSSTIVALSMESGTEIRFGLETAYAFYGKAKELQSGVGLVTESSTSFGDRFRIRPSVEFGWGPRVRLGTSGALKVVRANDYPFTEYLYNGGGLLWGVEQSLKWMMGPKVTTKLTLGYNRVTNYDAAYDADGLMTNVTYNDVSFGTGVGYQW